MSFKLSSAIALARTVLNDTDSSSYRYAVDDLLKYGNGFIRALATIKPELLYTEGDLQCEGGKALQAVSFDDAHSLVNVVRIKNGNVVLPADKAALDAFSPGWMAATAGAAQNWMPQGSDPRRFYIYPPAPIGQVLEVIYVAIPGPYTEDEETYLPDTLTEAAADYIVGMAESRDDEHILSQRAAQFLAQSTARLKG